MSSLKDAKIFQLYNDGYTSVRGNPVESTLAGLRAVERAIAAPLLQRIADLEEELKERPPAPTQEVARVWACKCEATNLDLRKHCFACGADKPRKRGDKKEN